ncbi:hypothetical protein CR513_44281, partial [Mucuna pruriens]
MALPSSDEALTPFILHDLGMQNGEGLKRIQQAWKSTVRKGPEWGPRSYRASPSYKAWLKNRLEQTHANPLSGNQRVAQNAQEGKTQKEHAEKEESWFRMIAREKYFREKEREQALAKKQELKATLADS